MATASPTPMGSGHFSAPTRKPSLRSGLRRATSRPQLDRAQSNPAPSGHASSKSQYAATNADSSDDEIPVPMKLSALTKALLDDGGAVEPRPMDNGPSRVRTRAQNHAPSSPVQIVQEQEKPVKRRSILSASVAAIGEEKRHTRASSAQVSSRAASPARSQASPDNSLVKNRKRVVRLSTTPGAAAQFGTVQPSKRRSTSMSTSQKGNRPPSRESQGEEKANVSEVKDINTPNAQAVKSVRIVVGSSGGRGRSTGSSGVSSRRADSASHPPSENEAPEDPVTAPRHRAGLSQGSGSRPGSNGSRTRGDENQALQSSMRLKRVGKGGVGKVPGSFLSGPARRGRRRQSEEDGENDGEPLPPSQEESQLPPDLLDLEPIENLASSYYVPDRLASGSPVSAKDSARHKRERPVVEKESRVTSRQPSPEGDEIQIPHYKVPPPRLDMPSRHDQENEAPPTFKRNKALGSSMLEKDIAKLPARPQSADVGAVRPSSPERKALATVSQNTPRRAAPPPPPKMSILDAATSTAGAATTQQALKKRNYLKVNGKYYTRLDSLGRGGSAKVYRVAADNGRMFALKRVSIEGADESQVRGFKGEIDLLERLKGVERVIDLYDYEMNDEKKVLSLVSHHSLSTMSIL
jgi:serine/threonine-protein kinase TTK/MPS1